MACHRHLSDRAGRLSGLFQENRKSISSPTRSSPRWLLLSLDLLIYVVLPAFLLLSSPIIPQVNGKYLEDCEKSSLLPGSSSDISLSCKLRTINSEFDKTNFSALSGDSIASLTLECSNVLFYQSSLQAGSLAHLSRLQNLHIEHCKLSRLSPTVFSGLSLLKNLTVRTHNTQWPALSLDIASGVFSPLPQLEKIDISANNIWTFPDKVFCDAKSLEYLNVSLNRLQDISDLGFREREDNKSAPNSGCRLGIQVLDISYNRLILLPARGLASLSQLKELYLQGNEISMVADRALAGLNLRILNLTDNKISALPESLFNDSREISEIYLKNNSLVSLPPRLFSSLGQLLILDLSHNSLSFDESATSSPEGAKVSYDIFQNLVRLVLLDLSHNEITHLTPIFQDLISLQHLNLEFNDITSIEPSTFSSMTNLHTLILSHNKLTAIDATTLSGLEVVSIISLDNNEISQIHPLAFQNCPVNDLQLNGNALDRIPNAIQNLTLLKTVDLGENKISTLDGPRLINLHNLYGLRLTGNRITNLRNNTLQNLKSLRVLNLARNSITSIEKGAFDSNLNLQAIRLDSNFLQDISNLFADLPSLIWLNVSDNHITLFDYAMIPKQLQWLDLHKNEISDLGNYFQNNDLSLQTLDASFNRISIIGPQSIPDTIEMLFLNDNLISVIEPDTFYNKANLSRVDIFSNQIETLEIRSLQFTPFPMDKELPEFYIGGNPIQCTCEVEWLQRLGKNNNLRQHPKIMDLDSILCKLVYNRSNSYVPLIEAKQSDFLCKYENHCWTTCSCCEFAYCDCSQKCDSSCNCYYDVTWMRNVVDCSMSNQATIPQIPMDSSELYLDGNNYVTGLQSHVFIGKRNLRFLYLNNSAIPNIHNNSFSGLKLLSVLHLEDNLLTQLIGYEFSPLESLRELYLHGNQISFIANNTFESLRMLEVLTLHSNRLTTFAMWSLRHNPYLVEISLSQNPWACNNCEYLSQAVTFISNNVHKLTDAPNISCRVHNGKSLSLVYMNATNKCSEIIALSGASEAPETKLPPYLPLIASIISICLLIGFVFLTVCRRRNSFRIWVAAKCYQTPLDDDREKLYDAYIMYSQKDEAWVTQVFGVELQQQQLDNPYRLCFHYKDFPVTAYIADTIVEAVNCSQSQVLVISKHFLQTEWRRFEFKSALHSALRGKRNLVAITLGELQTRDLDPDLRVCLRSATVLSANDISDKLFFKKLRAALSPPRTCYTARLTMSRPGSGESGSVGSASVHNYSLGGASTLPLNISSDSSASSNHLHHFHHHPTQSSHHNNSMTLSHHHHAPSHQFYNSSTLGTNGFLPNGNAPTSHLNGNATGNVANNNISSNNSDNNTNNGNVSVPLYVPPFPPPNRPPPPFPAPRRPPPPTPLWA